MSVHEHLRGRLFPSEVVTTKGFGCLKPYLEKNGHPGSGRYLRDNAKRLVRGPQVSLDWPGTICTPDIPQRASQQAAVVPQLFRIDTNPGVTDGRNGSQNRPPKHGQNETIRSCLTDDPTTLTNGPFQPLCAPLCFSLLSPS